MRIRGRTRTKWHNDSKAYNGQGSIKKKMNAAKSLIVANIEESRKVDRKTNTRVIFLKYKNLTLERKKFDSNLFNNITEFTTF